MIAVQGLSLWHGRDCILDEISFEVPMGETLAIVGESGSGKTSLARLLMGLLPGRYAEPGCEQRLRGFHWCGRALMGELDVARAPRLARKRFRGQQAGLIVQALADALNPQMSVRQHLREVSAQHRLDVTDDTICADWNIPARLLDRYPAGLSGGEIQRILTALALLPAPRFLILDEPTAALDTANRAKAIASFRKGSDLRCQILITHDLDLAKTLSDRVAILKSGRIVEQGATRSVFRAPSDAYTKRLLKADHSTKPAVSRTQALANGSGLSIRNLCHSYGGRPVFQNLSIDIFEASCLAVLGESGAGKTTLARLVAGLEQPRSGRIAWHREDREVPFRVAMVSQHPHRAMARHFTVSQVLGEAIALEQNRLRNTRPSGRARIGRICGLLDAVGLPSDHGFLNRRSAALSGGEAQRLVIARALAIMPDILVADEPTAALDMVSRSKLLDLLHRLKEERRLTLLLATHDVAAAGALSDRVLNLCDPG